MEYVGFVLLRSSCLLLIVIFIYDDDIYNTPYFLSYVYHICQKNPFLLSFFLQRINFEKQIHNTTRQYEV